MSDKEAEQAILDVMAEFASANMPLNISTVPKAATKRLDRNSGDPTNRIDDAINRLVARGLLIAPREPWESWQLQKVDQEQAGSDEGKK